METERLFIGWFKGWLRMFSLEKAVVHSG